MIRAGVLTKRETLCLKYRWEFLRRNREYQKDYRYITINLKVTDIIRNQYPKHLINEALSILSKWDLLNPIPPGLSFNALLESDKRLKSFHMDSLFVNDFAIDIYDSPDSLSPKDLYIKGSLVRMYVNMRFPKEKILDEFELLVDKWQKPLKKMMRKVFHDKPQKRLQLKQYEKY